MRKCAFHFLFVLAISLCSPNSLLAGSYFGLEGTSFHVENGDTESLNPKGIRVKMGLRLNEALDIEAQLGGGSDSDALIFDRFATAYAGMFAKLYTPVGRRSSLFATIGMANIEHSQTLDSRVFTDNHSSFAYGFGLETMLNKRLDLTADFIQYASDEGLFEDMSAVSIGFKWYL